MSGRTHSPTRSQRHRSSPWLAATISFLVSLAVLGTMSPTGWARYMPATPASKRYLDRIHAKVYGVWVNDVLRRVAARTLPSDPFNDPGRKVTFRIHFSPSGVVLDVKEVRKSGYKRFDVTARHMLLMAYGFPTPPPLVRSEDGHVYVEITFQRSKPYVDRSALRVLELLFTRTLIPAGKLSDALTRLSEAARAGRLARYARSFGQEVMKLAVAQHGRVVAGELVATLDDRRTPLTRFDFVLKARLTDGQLARALAALVRRTEPAAVRVLTRSFARQQASPARSAGTLVHLEALWKLSRAVAPSRGLLWALLRSSSPLLRAHAAALLHRFVAVDRPKAEAALLALLNARDPKTLLTALPLAARAGGSEAVYKRIQQLTNATRATATVRTAAILALPETGRADAWRKLLELTYTRQGWQRNAACQALVRLTSFGKAICYRYVGYLKSPQSSDTLLTAAAHGLAAQCSATHLPNLRRAFFSYRNSVKLGLARGLPGGKPLAEAVLLRLAKGRNRAIRHAALTNMARNPRAAYRPLLAALVGEKDPALRRLAYPFATDPTLLRLAWKAEQDPTHKLSLARRILRLQPAIIYPWLHAHLQSTSWKRRVRAAHVLLAP
ncbi:MAG: TonB C-terminal domain-containing protein [bacterium]